MSAVRNLVNDLVDRRLWPVAIALLGALVAVPVLLGGGSKAPAPAPAAPLAAAASTGGTAQAAISVSTPPTAPRYRSGPVRNPFKQHHVPAPVTTPVAAPAAPTAPSVPSSAGLPTTPSPSLPGTSVTPIVPGSGGGKRDTTTAPVWRVNLRFGEAGDQKVHRDVPRLTPLPSATDPFFIFLGILADGKTAVFLISSDATATGDGACKPNPDQCDTIELRAGDSEFFDVAQGNAGTKQYELDLLKVFHGAVKGKTAAAKAAKTVSADGKNVIHELKAEGSKVGMGRYIWSSRRGVLVRRHKLRATATASSRSTGASPGAQMSGVFGVTWTG